MIHFLKQENALPWVYTWLIASQLFFTCEAGGGFKQKPLGGGSTKPDWKKFAKEESQTNKFVKNLSDGTMMGNVAGASTSKHGSLGRAKSVEYGPMLRSIDDQIGSTGSGKGGPYKSSQARVKVTLQEPVYANVNPIQSRKTNAKTSDPQTAHSISSSILLDQLKKATGDVARQVQTVSRPVRAIGGALPGEVEDSNVINDTPYDMEVDELEEFLTNMQSPTGSALDLSLGKNTFTYNDLATVRVELLGPEANQGESTSVVFETLIPKAEATLAEQRALTEAVKTAIDEGSNAAETAVETIALEEGVPSAAGLTGVAGGAMAGSGVAAASGVPSGGAVAFGSVSTLGAGTGFAAAATPNAASGAASGAVSGSATGMTSGSISGTVSGSASGAASGAASGSASGTASGSAVGSASGAASGSATATGTASGSASGSATATGTASGSSSGIVQNPPATNNAFNTQLNQANNGMVRTSSRIQMEPLMEKPLSKPLSNSQTSLSSQTSSVSGDIPSAYQPSFENPVYDPATYVNQAVDHATGKTGQQATQAAGEVVGEAVGTAVKAGTSAAGAAAAGGAVIVGSASALLGGAVQIVKDIVNGVKEGAKKHVAYREKYFAEEAAKKAEAEKTEQERLEQEKQRIEKELEAHKKEQKRIQEEQAKLQKELKQAERDKKQAVKEMEKALKKHENAPTEKLKEKAVEKAEKALEKHEKATKKKEKLEQEEKLRNDEIVKQNTKVKTEIEEKEVSLELPEVPKETVGNVANLVDVPNLPEVPRGELSGIDNPSFEHPYETIDGQPETHIYETIDGSNKIEVAKVKQANGGERIQLTKEQVTVHQSQGTVIANSATKEVFHSLDTVSSKTEAGRTVSEQVKTMEKFKAESTKQYQKSKLTNEDLDKIEVANKREGAQESDRPAQETKGENIPLPEALERALKLTKAQKAKMSKAEIKEHNEAVKILMKIWKPIRYAGKFPSYLMDLFNKLTAGHRFTRWILILFWISIINVGVFKLVNYIESLSEDDDENGLVNAMRNVTSPLMNEMERTASSLNITSSQLLNYTSNLMMENKELLQANFNLTKNLLLMKEKMMDDRTNYEQSSPFVVLDKDVYQTLLDNQREVILLKKIDKVISLLANADNDETSKALGKAIIKGLQQVDPTKLQKAIQHAFANAQTEFNGDTPITLKRTREIVRSLMKWTLHDETEAQNTVREYILNLKNTNLKGLQDNLETDIGKFDLEDVPQSSTETTITVDVTPVSTKGTTTSPKPKFPPNSTKGTTQTSSPTTFVEPSHTTTIQPISVMEEEYDVVEYDYEEYDNYRVKRSPVVFHILHDIIGRIKDHIKQKQIQDQVHIIEAHPDSVHDKLRELGVLPPVQAKPPKDDDEQPSDVNEEKPQSSTTRGDIPSVVTTEWPMTVSALALTSITTVTSQLETTTPSSDTQNSTTALDTQNSTTTSPPDISSDEPWNMEPEYFYVLIAFLAILLFVLLYLAIWLYVDYLSKEEHFVQRRNPDQADQNMFRPERLNEEIELESISTEISDLEN